MFKHPFGFPELTDDEVQAIEAMSTKDLLNELEAILDCLKELRSGRRRISGILAFKDAYLSVR